MKAVAIGLGTCGISAGGEKVYKAFQDELKEHPGAFVLKETGCIGMCYREVLVEVSNGDGMPHLYGDVTPDRVGKIVEREILNDEPIDEWLVLGQGREKGYSKIRCASFSGIAERSIRAQSRILLPPAAIRQSQKCSRR